MPWVQAEFKGKTVWAEVGADGAPLVEGGRRSVRYNDKPGSTVYKAGAAGIKDLGGAPRELAEGTAAPDRDEGATGARGGRGSGFGKAGTRTAAQTAAAKVDAKQKLAELPAGTAVCFTDGACAGNPGPAGSGAVVRLPDGEKIEKWKGLGEGTNNIAELVAIGIALEVLREKVADRATPVAVFTDSDYSVGVLSRNWKPKANMGLIAGLKRALAEWPNAKLYWIAGHAGVPENERADELARMGVRDSR